MKSNGSVLFLTLSTFSLTGGIEKVCRIAGKALFEISKQVENDFIIYSLHDKKGDEKGNKYFPSGIFKGFDSRILNFIWSSVVRRKGKSNTVILSHINLLVVGYLIKLLSPKTKLILFAHGIEIWPRLSFHKRFMLKKCDTILAVSSYTKRIVEEINHVSGSKVQVLNNCIDPFLPDVNELNALRLKELYQLNGKNVLLNVTRYSNKERYKGYDHVLLAMQNLIGKFPNLHFLLVGKYDKEEKARIDMMVKNYNLDGRVTFTGFIKDEELADHFKISDLFVMPSEKEGFGIVFIEALYYGLPVIGGNKDGTVDALLGGKLGTVVTPGNIGDIQYAISNSLIKKNNMENKRELLLKYFSYPTYKKNLNDILLALN